MPHIDEEIERLKKKLMQMWDVVEFQLVSGREAMINADQRLAKKIIKQGDKVNDYDVKIDRMCENFFALFTPVAVDLRVVLAILKINANLERIGDTAEGIAYFVREFESPLEQELLQATKVLEMYDEALSMFADCRRAFLDNDTELATQLIKRDKFLNKIYRKSDSIVIPYLKENPDKIKEGVALLSIIKKIERVGDQVSNVAEEIIFYRDAKVVKHQLKKKKKE
ncbi:phosphate signaling complex protein PhoU [Cesiribacter sp. SM1]|uniref:phosphate signaling complex protein PhoU n=1 Tax=Cesiribacter sp. SM1 TaxID=2861196 RepID=UPI001CD56662|nr:phosphate signaling complex protein PhoU [Cesiribacter sp. SM1]